MLYTRFIGVILFLLFLEHVLILPGDHLWGQILMFNKIIGPKVHNLIHYEVALSGRYQDSETVLTKSSE